MNHSRLTLTLPPTLGSENIEVDTKRFSIGRTPENDLVIEDSSLSRRHALIENYEGRFNLSDCGSSNGTFVNGKSVDALTELSDWDVLTFGGVSDILVRIEDDSALGTHASGVQPTAAAPTTATFAQSPRAVSPHPWLSGPVIAVASAVLIILITGLALLIAKNSESRGSKPVIRQKQQPIETEGGDNRTSTPNYSVPSPSVNSGPNNPTNPESSELSIIEAYALKVLTGISKDTHPVLTEKPLAEINAQVHRYKGSSTLRDELQAMKRSLPQVSATAKSNGVRAPLAVYATLARIDKDGGRGDPSQVAASLCPSLARMRALFGDELANDTLLAVAALEEGPGLQAKITKQAGRGNESVTTIRSIWYLHEHQVISDQTYK